MLTADLGLKCRLRDALESELNGPVLLGWTNNRISGFPIFFTILIEIRGKKEKK